jgi:hypothetical protein
MNIFPTNRGIAVAVAFIPAMGKAAATQLSAQAPEHPGPRTKTSPADGVFRPTKGK